jgi:1-deoxy-D-xylulose-5-phosphate reductoisomerase
VSLEFYAPDLDKFTCLRQAFDALKQGGSAMGTLNAANEVAVEHFLNNKISFLA